MGAPTLVIYIERLLYKDTVSCVAKRCKAWLAAWLSISNACSINEGAQVSCVAKTSPRHALIVGAPTLVLYIERLFEAQLAAWLRDVKRG